MSSYIKNINKITIDKIEKNRIYDTDEVGEIIGMCRKSVINRVKNGLIKTIPRRKFEKYRIFGVEILRFLNYTDEYNIEDYSFSSTRSSKKSSKSESPYSSFLF